MNDALRRENHLGKGEIVHAGVAQGQIKQLQKGDRTGGPVHDVEDQAWAKTFQADPSALYLNIIQLLDRPKEVQNEAFLSL